MKRLKIVEQIIIVLVLAVIIPFITMGFIISNVSQQSVRLELANNATLMAQFIGDTVEKYVNFSQDQLNQIASGFEYIPNTMAKIQYFDDIESKSNLFVNMDIIKKDKIPNKLFDSTNGFITLISPIESDKNYYLRAQISINIIDALINKENQKGRNIYIFDSKTKELLATNANKNSADQILSELNMHKQIKEAALFGKMKNTPKAYYEIENPKWFVVVDTTRKVTSKTITKARYRIILSLCLGALFIFIMTGLYTFYLYINIRQLFKGITAISKGNYDKKIHLIKSAFTPSELVFLAKEFNYMANKINVSYKDLREKNIELEKLNEFRDNLVSATSHEFRTPLTSIIGYTSRLLRNDIVVDEAMRIKSLQVIKQQAQRLSGMVEDLLVIPELDSFSLKFNITEVDLINAITSVLEYLANDSVQFECDIEKNIGPVWADEYRLEQIILNLVDNAIKYSLNNNPIKIKSYLEGKMPVVEIINKCEKISDDIKEKLFEKFIRADSKLTRTTRGTGLGLYIVKGLAKGMNIDLECHIDDEFKMVLKFKDYV